MIVFSILQRDLAVHGLNLQTPKRSNMIDRRDRNWVRLLIKKGFSSLPNESENESKKSIVLEVVRRSRPHLDNLVNLLAEWQIYHHSNEPQYLNRDNILAGKILAIVVIAVQS